MYRRLVIFLTVLMVLSFYSIAPIAQTATTTNVDTVIIVNGGDVSTLDAAIAAAISADIGAHVLYTEHEEVPADLQTQLKNLDAENVVILGGQSVVSENIETSLQDLGYDVTRLHGTTATGTAVEAIEYFYGPGTLDEVSLVKYEGDTVQDYSTILTLAAELGQPIIPIPSDVEGLPGEVTNLLATTDVEQVTLVGDFDQEAAIEEDLQEVRVDVETKIEGNIDAVEDQLQNQVLDTLTEGDQIVFVEEGEVAPVLPDHKTYFYKDENNDGLDDESGSVLDGIGLGLYDQYPFLNKECKFVGDNEDVQKRFEEAMESAGIQVSAGKVGDSIGTAFTFTNEEAAKLSEHFAKKEEEFKNLYERNKGLFESETTKAADQAKAFLELNKDKLSPTEIELGYKFLEELDKGDVQSAWKLFHKFENHVEFNDYKEVVTDSAEVARRVGLEKADLDKLIEEFGGKDVALQAANLDAGKKIGLLGLVPPGHEEAFRAKMQEFIASGVKPEDWGKEFSEEYKKDGYEHYYEEAKERHDYCVTAKCGFADDYKDPSKWAEEEKKKYFEEGIRHEGEAVLSNLVNPEDLSDPTKVAQVINRVDAVDYTLQKAGVTDTHYLNPEDWQKAYQTYATEGKLSSADIKQYEATVTAYRTYEAAHQGDFHAPEAGNYDAAKGTFTYVDPTSGQAVSGTYTQGQYTYTDPTTGTTYTGTNTGAVYEHTETGYHAPEGYSPPTSYPTPPDYITPSGSTGTTTQTTTSTTSGGTSTSTGSVYSYPTPQSYSTPYGTPDSYSSPYGTPESYSYPTPHSGHFVLVDIPDYIRSVLERAGFVCEKDPTTQRFTCRYGLPG